MPIIIEDSNPVGIVNKPQFDTNVFRIGKAIHVIGTIGGYKMDKDCLIKDSNPLEIRVVFIDSEGDEESISIGIIPVANGTIKIRFKEDK